MSPDAGRREICAATLDKVSLANIAMSCCQGTRARWVLPDDGDGARIWRAERKSSIPLVLAPGFIGVDLLHPLSPRRIFHPLLLTRAIIKELGRSFDKGLLPGMNLGGVDFKPAGQFRDGLFSLERAKKVFAPTLRV
jgi:hypothetical protein